MWLFWDLVRTSIEAIRTTALATNPAAVTPAPAPHLAGMVAGDASTLFLVIFGGILCGYVGSLIGGSLGGGGFRTVLPLRAPARETAPSAKAASA